MLVCANARGSVRLPLLILGKSKNPRALKNYSSQDVKYIGSGNGWMTRDIFQHWFHTMFVPTVRSYGIEKCVLVVDNCNAHLPVDNLRDGDIWTITLPPNVTSLIQPMDQGVIVNMKGHYKSQFLREYMDYSGNVEEFQRSYSIKDCLENLSKSWDT